MSDVSDRILQNIFLAVSEGADLVGSFLSESQKHYFKAYRSNMRVSRRLSAPKVEFKAVPLRYFQQRTHSNKRNSNYYLNI